MANTTNLNIALVAQNQSQKEVTVNEALKAIDAILNTGVIDKDLSTPPGSPTAGDVYIVGASATDDWATHEDDIAYFDGVWRFITPKEGFMFWVRDEDAIYAWDGSAWALAAQGASSILTNIANLTLGNYNLINTDGAGVITATSTPRVDRIGIGDVADGTLSIRTANGAWIKGRLGVETFPDAAHSIKTANGVWVGGKLGIGTAPDATHLINVFGPSILYNAAAGFTQQMNKSGAGDDLKLLFQQGFTTFAELGLLADNDFRLKVSDGVDFFDAWIIDRLTGNTNFVQQANISGHSPINHKNYIINGDCKVAQRSSYTLVKDVYDFGSVDRFAGMATGTAVSAGSLTHSAFSGKDYVKFEQVTLTGAGQLFLRTRIEAQDAEIFNGQKASVSMSVFHDVGSAIDFTITVRKADSADDFSSATDIANSGTISVDDSSETVIKFENVDMGTCENGIEVELQIDAGAITTKDFLLRKFQLELGEVVTQFVTEPIADTLRKCKRYYQALGKGINGAFSSGNEIDVAFTYPVEMRDVPTGTLLDTTPAINHTGVGGKTGSGSSIAGGGTSYSTDGAYVRIDGFSGGTGRDPVFITDDNVIGLSAEL